MHLKIKPSSFWVFWVGGLVPVIHPVVLIVDLHTIHSIEHPESFNMVNEYMDEINSESKTLTNNVVAVK